MSSTMNDVTMERTNTTWTKMWRTTRKRAGGAGRGCVPLALLVALAMVARAEAQTGSLYHQQVPLTGDRAIELKDLPGYIEPPPPRQLRKYDIVTIRIDDVSRVRSDGEITRRKNGLYDAILKDWPLLIGLRALKPSPQAQGDQRANGQLNSLYRAEGELEANESIAFSIAAQIVDIRPNGNLVLEARKNIQINNEVWEVNVLGECRAEDVGPDNVVISRNVANLRVTKRERGHVRDAYRRGWIVKVLDLFAPF